MGYGLKNTGASDPMRIKNIILFSIISLLFPLSAHAEERLKEGKAIYQRWCSSCHGEGLHSPGTLALKFKYGGDKPALLEEREDLDYATLEYFIRNGISVMPSFRPTEISGSDIRLIEYYINNT